MDRFENNYIDGAWVKPVSSGTIKVLNPSNGETIASVPDSTAEDVAKAVDAARKAQLRWERLSAIERAGYLCRISAKLREHKERLALRVSLCRHEGRTRIAIWRGLHQPRAL